MNTAATAVYNKSEVLYGLDVATTGLAGPRAPGEQRRRTLVVMEGYTDCLMAYQAGFTSAVATCGTALTPLHLKKLRSYADDVVLMFDGDEAGRRASRAALQLFLASEMNVRLATPPDGLDPCDLIRQRGVEAAPTRWSPTRSAALEYHVSQILANRSIGGRADRRLDQIASLLAEIPPTASVGDGSAKYNLAISTVVDAFKVDEKTLRQRIDELRRPTKTMPTMVETDRLRATAPSNARSPHTQAPHSGWSTRPTTSAHRSVATAIPTIGPLPRTGEQRQIIVQWLVAHPSVACPLLRSSRIDHPVLRRLAIAALAVFEDFGAAATTDHIRELLDHPILDSYVIDLLETAAACADPDAEIKAIKSEQDAFDERARLKDVRQQVAATDDDSADLAALRRIVGGTETPRPTTISPLATGGGRC